MGMNEIIWENETLRKQYTKAMETITKLTRKLEKLENENKILQEQIEKLKIQNENLTKQVKVLRRAIEIASSIDDCKKQEINLKKS